MSSDARTARVIATISLAVALLALVLAGYALSLEQARTDELHELSESVRRALEARGTPVRPPPVGLDTEE